MKSLVEMHGGDIKLRSAPGAGTTITVLIPDGSARMKTLDSEGRAAVHPGAGQPAAHV